MLWLKKEFKLNNNTIILQKTPMSFDAAQWEILSLCCGSTIVMGNPGTYKDPEKLIEIIIKNNVTVFQCVPTLLQAILDSEKIQHCQSLNQIFSGGEALSKSLAITCITTLPACKLINIYGPTECTINTSAYAVNAHLINDLPNTIPIGQPILNTRYFILDENCQAVTPGETGELYISGVGLARGYLHRDDLTAQSFSNFLSDEKTRLYKTGDLAYRTAEGNVHFVGRIDNQVKIRGFRIELDEIKSLIETHDWVKKAAVIVKDDSYTGYQALIGFIELNPKEAALMDQGNHGAHHQSKNKKDQVLMQLANKGFREETELSGFKIVDLPGKTPEKHQRQLAFSRKNYRFYEGKLLNKNDLLQLFNEKTMQQSFEKIEDLNLDKLGHFLRYFGQYTNEERLLPKYAYASPGALYATQMYFELDNIASLKSGFYYYYPASHQLILLDEKKASTKAEIKIHFIGKKSAIEPIYKNNIQEVLEMETGHMIGLFEKILIEYGLNIDKPDYIPSIKSFLKVAQEDFYLGTYEIVSGKKGFMDDGVQVYLQAHPGKIAGLEAGLYLYHEQQFEKISDQLILRKHVIAINQEVYDRASFGVSIITKGNDNWMSYINLGRKLQSYQMNNFNIGFMSSGYSSKSGNNLPSAKRLQDILETERTTSYFCIGGSISDSQRTHCGMKEDVVHMKGPTEMIQDDLKNFLPEHMMPNKIILLDQMPLTANGKLDHKSLQNINVEFTLREYIAPTSETELKIAEIWQQRIKRDAISINDNFFELGGNSLIAVTLINNINKLFKVNLPLQTIFKYPTIEKLAEKVLNTHKLNISRLISLQTKGQNPSIYCWPGLGGYCMNLRLLAEKAGTEQPFYGIQAYGINQDEIPYPSLQTMAAEDIKIIKEQQPEGPYSLWGYSFGARVAYEATWQLEQAGETVKHLILIAPGNPIVDGALKNDGLASFSNKTYLSILFSVFTGSITGSLFAECLKSVTDEASFIQFIIDKIPHLDFDLVKRIITIVEKTYQLNFTTEELINKKLCCPVTILKTKGDSYTFLENKGFSSKNHSFIQLNANHYSVLKNLDIDELIAEINRAGNTLFEQQVPQNTGQVYSFIDFKKEENELMQPQNEAVSI